MTAKLEMVYKSNKSSKVYQGHFYSGSKLKLEIYSKMTRFLDLLPNNSKFSETELANVHF